MSRLRYHVSVWLFDLAAWIYPLPHKSTTQAHHVGNDRWLEWKIENADYNRSSHCQP